MKKLGVKMDKLTKPKMREIIDDFARAIETVRVKSSPPKTTVINFRNEAKRRKPRTNYDVPIGLLRYRRDNGRISSNVLNYEKDNGLLSERSEEAQKIIRNFLQEKDKEKTDELKRLIEHDGQRESAIITCDGFLINGNRRKMVFENLLEKYPGDERFKTMRVVILPGKGDEGGPPTLLEIEEIENRYQLQSEGKAEYSAFDRALSMRHKIEIEMSLEAQLRDDPLYANRPPKEFKKAIKEFKDKFLSPLECIDRYLSNLRREGLYSTVSKGLGDPEGRWQAFHDYYNFLYKRIDRPKERMKLDIGEDEVGKIEDICFKIIRMRQVQGLPGITKVHDVMRKMRNWLQNKESKKELFRLIDIPLRLPKEETTDDKGRLFSGRIVDNIWAQKHRAIINGQLKKAICNFEHKKEQETPIALLKAALNKLNHEDMRADSVKITDIPEAMRLAGKIQKRSKEIGSEFFDYKKEYDKFRRNHKR